MFGNFSRDILGFSILSDVNVSRDRVRYAMYCPACLLFSTTKYLITYWVRSMDPVANFHLY